MASMEKTSEALMLMQLRLLRQRLQQQYCLQSIFDVVGDDDAWNDAAIVCVTELCSVLLVHLMDSPKMNATEFQ